MFRPFFSTSNINIFHLLRSSVIITTLACIIGVHKGFRQPIFKGAVGHDMKDFTPESSSKSRCFSILLVFLFQLAALIGETTKSGPRLQDGGHADRKTWDMD
jgi:hypothetical protein